MFDPRRHAAALMCVVALTLPASAPAQEPALLAQIEDATQTPQPQPQPPLSEDPPSQLGGEETGEDADRGDGRRGGGEDDAATGGGQLPETGIDAALIALLGLGMVASGSGLRLTLRRGV